MEAVDVVWLNDQCLEDLKQNAVADKGHAFLHAERPRNCCCAVEQRAAPIRFELLAISNHANILNSVCEVQQR